MSDLALLAFALALGLASRALWFGRGTARRPAEPPASAELALWVGPPALAASLLAGRALF